MLDERFLPAQNPAAVVLEDIPDHAPSAFTEAVASALEKGMRLVALFGTPDEKTAKPWVIAAIADDADGEIGFARMAPTPRYPSITARHPSAHGLERALWEDWLIEPQGHPWLKPLRRTVDLPEGRRTDYYKVTGYEVHEVAVGPVHAGIIEPGHFRFMCQGETVHHLEISLGYQHRGARSLLLGEPSPRWAPAAESVTGDSSVAGALAHALCIEALTDTEPSFVADTVRTLALELERLAYHIGDLGALANDVGFLPTAQYNGRIRGDFLNALLTLSGSRHGRGLIRPGGVLNAPAEPESLSLRLIKHFAQARESVDLMLEAPSVMARFEQTGRVSTEDAKALGLLGVAARASGLERDIRTTHPHGLYRFKNVPLVVASQGDVHARAFVRSAEMNRSIEVCLDLLKSFPQGEVRHAPEPLRPSEVALAMVEGWRGQLVHARVTDSKGRVVAAEVVDPSVQNWFGLALALRGQGISDFPLCNKSFNLAYAGHDL